MNINFENTEYVVPFFGRIHMNNTHSEYDVAPQLPTTNVIISGKQRAYLKDNDCYMTVFSMPLISLIRMATVSKDIENLNMATLTHLGHLTTDQMVYFGVFSTKEVDALHFFKEERADAINLVASVWNTLDPEDIDLKAPENQGYVTLPYIDLEAVLSLGLQYCNSQDRLRFHRSFLSNNEKEMKKEIKNILGRLTGITPEARDRAVEEYSELSGEMGGVTIEGLDGIELDPIPESPLERIFNFQEPLASGKCSVIQTMQGEFIVPVLDEEIENSEMDDASHSLISREAINSARRAFDANDDYDDDDFEDDDDGDFYSDDDYPYAQEEDDFAQQIAENTAAWQNADGHLNSISTFLCVLDLEEYMDLPEDYTPRHLIDYLKKRGIEPVDIVSSLREFFVKQLGIRKA